MMIPADKRCPLLASFCLTYSPRKLAPREGRQAVLVITRSLVACVNECTSLSWVCVLMLLALWLTAGTARAASGPCTPEALDSCKSACSSGDGDACAVIAKAYGTRNGRRNKERAYEFAERSCDLGNARGCGILGVLLYKGSGVEQDQERAMRVLTSSCEGGVTVVCEELERLRNMAESAPTDWGSCSCTGRALIPNMCLCSKTDCEAWCTQNNAAPAIHLGGLPQCAWVVRGGECRAKFKGSEAKPNRPAPKLDITVCTRDFRANGTPWDSGRYPQRLPDLEICLRDGRGEPTCSPSNCVNSNTCVFRDLSAPRAGPIRITIRDRDEEPACLWAGDLSVDTESADFAGSGFSRSKLKLVLRSQCCSGRKISATYEGQVGGPANGLSAGAVVSQGSATYKNIVMAGPRTIDAHDAEGDVFLFRFAGQVAWHQDSIIVDFVAGKLHGRGRPTQDNQASLFESLQAWAASATLAGSALTTEAGTLRVVPGSATSEPCPVDCWDLPPCAPGSVRDPQACRSAECQTPHDEVGDGALCEQGKKCRVGDAGVSVGEAESSPQEACRPLYSKIPQGNPNYQTLERACRLRWTDPECSAWGFVRNPKPECRPGFGQALDCPGFGPGSGRE